MSTECKALPAVSRVASAVGALAITSVLLLAVGLGFPPRAAAQTAARPATASVKATTVAVASVTGAAAPLQADAASIARGRYIVSISGCNDCYTPRP